MNEHMTIRLATAADLPAINDIYNHYVPLSTCTYQYQPETLATRRAWFAAHDERHPVTVIETTGEIFGWGSLGTFRNRDGYIHTVEDSVYVRHDCHRRGIGRLLLADLIDRAERLGHRTIVAGMSADQTASIRLHEQLGFVKVAHLHQVGHKFDRWLDVVFMQRMLVVPREAESPAPSPPWPMPSPE